MQKTKQRLTYLNGLTRKNWTGFKRIREEEEEEEGVDVDQAT